MSSRSLEYIFRDRASTMFNSLANASVLREFSGVKHRSVTMPMFKSYAFGHFGNVVSKISWTEKSGKDIPSHVHDVRNDGSFLSIPRSSRSQDPATDKLPTLETVFSSCEKLR